MDIRILLDTVLLDLKRDGISTDEMVNFDDFRKKQWEMDAEKDARI